jgi:hypothetical protein
LKLRGTPVPLCHKNRLALRCSSHIGRTKRAGMETRREAATLYRDAQGTAGIVLNRGVERIDRQSYGVAAVRRGIGKIDMILEHK